jgi:hypothetical protein
MRQRKAVEQGRAGAQFVCAFYPDRGKRVIKDLAPAAHCYQYVSAVKLNKEFEFMKPIRIHKKPKSQ